MILKKYIGTALLIAALSLLFFSCKNDSFKIKGEIYGGAEKTILLEKSDFQGRWLPVDSVHINKNGGFSFSFPTPQSPEIYRLSLNNQYVYVPVDSTETITLNSSYDKFGHDFELAGSNNAEMMARFEKELQKIDTSNKSETTEFKRKVFSNYIKDHPGSILGFYILTKTIDDTPLYDPTDKTDSKYFTAVATGYKTVKPNDPHTALLEEVALNAIKRRNTEEGKFKTIEADEISLIDINLPDETGKNIKLSDLAGKGKKVVVIFSVLNNPESPQLNRQLAALYNKVSSNTEFYNVAIDEDQYEWREAAKNLPWITVYSPGQTESQEVMKYNVYQLPSFFIYDEKGELTKRTMTIDDLKNSL